MGGLLEGISKTRCHWALKLLQLMLHQKRDLGPASGVYTGIRKWVSMFVSDRKSKITSRENPENALKYKGEKNHRKYCSSFLSLIERFLVSTNIEQKNDLKNDSMVLSFRDRPHVMYLAIQLLLDIYF